MVYLKGIRLCKVDSDGIDHWNEEATVVYLKSIRLCEVDGDGIDHWNEDIENLSSNVTQW